MKQKTLITIVITAIILLLVYLITEEILFSPKLSEPLSWKEITPGKTHLKDIERLLGSPDEQTIHNGFRIDTYNDRKDLGWEWIEIWYKDSAAEDRVGAVSLSFPYEDYPEQYTLESFVKLYGKPNFVTWSLSPYRRYVGWTYRGIAVKVLVDPQIPLDLTGIKRIKTINVLLFQPMTLHETVSTKWPWRFMNGWTFSNQYPPDKSHTPDELPEDPFDWSKLVP